MTGRAAREWALNEPDSSLVGEIRAAAGLTETVAKILVNRGIADPRAAERFLLGTLQDVTSPFLMKDLEKAAARLLAAGLGNEPVLVYADYDVDGATGAACLLLFLEEAFPGLPVSVHQNHRVADGYGLKAAHLDAAADAGIRLVVTVDCGISDAEAIRHAAARGMDVIVTDHHLPGAVLPPAHAVVNPKRPDCPYPEKELAGVGVAFMLACGVRRLLRDARGPGEGDALPNLRQYLDLVALGTVADMVPLRGDNRLFVKAGLEEIRARPRPGMLALLSVAGVAPGAVTETDLGFRIGPRLNAAGRVGDSRRSAGLLVTRDRAEAFRIASELHADNARRQAEEERIYRSAEAALLSGPPPSSLGAIVLSDPGWHAGVLGIVASRISEKYDRPTVLLKVDGGEATGSCRSAGGFPLVDALSELSHLLSRHGGHHQAAGVSLPLENLPAFRKGFDRLAGGHAAGREGPARIPVDARIALRDITPGLMNELERLRPFGMGNAEPVLLAEGLKLTREAPFGGDGRHLRFEVSGGDRRFETVAFRRTVLPVRTGERLDLLFSPQWSVFRGSRSIRLLLRDARPAGGAEAAREPSAP